MEYSYDCRAKVGKVEVAIDSKSGHGYGEHDDHGELGELTVDVETRELIDYDGVFDLGTDYAAAIEALGFHVPTEALSPSAHKVRTEHGNCVSALKPGALTIKSHRAGDARRVDALMKRIAANG